MNPFPNRPSWDEYFLMGAAWASTRASCTRRKIGALIVDDRHRVISHGYNGAPPGMPDCLEDACPRGLLSPDQLAHDSPYDDPARPGYCISVHAEGNTMLHAAGRDLVGATMYIASSEKGVSSKPCPRCQKDLAAAQIKRVVWRDADGYMCEDIPRLMLPRF